MLFVLTLLVFCAAAAYISAPFRSHRSTPVAVATPDAILTEAAPNIELRRRAEAAAEIEILVARTRRRLRLQASQPIINAKQHAWQCAECGREMGSNDRFCASCGTARPV